MNSDMEDAMTLARTKQEATAGVKALIEYLEEGTPIRDGVKDTPERVVRAFEEFTEGYFLNPHDILSKKFDLDDDEQLNGMTYDQMIVSKDIPFNSLCEHHLLPFTGYAHVAYIPALEGKVVGLSKLARVVEAYAKRLQVQERMTQQIANVIQEVLEPRGVAVIVTGKHMCQHLRGVKKSGTMVTSAMYGFFRTNETFARSELMELLKLK